jgi:hypothetical protein
MVADHQVSQHQGRIGREQNSSTALHRREQRLTAYPFRAPGLPWYFRRTARHYCRREKKHEHWQ